MTTLIQRFLENERALAQAKGRRFRVARPPRAQPPDSVERSYRAYLVELVDTIRADINRYLLPEIPSLVRMTSDRLDAARHDIDDIEAILRRTTDVIRARLNNQHLRDLEGKVAAYREETSLHVLRQLRRQIRRMIALDAFPAVGTAERAQLEAFLRGNVKLIQSLTGDYVEQVENMVRTGIQAGDRAVTIEQKIDTRWKVARSRAQLIARDQVNKLNGSLARVRQQALGIEKYIWRTSRDERVRNTHIVKEGRVYSWTKPPADTGHPGHDYQCRCTAEPYIEDEPPPAEDRKEIIRSVLKQRDVLREEIKGKPGARLIPRKRPKGF